MYIINDIRALLVTLKSKSYNYYMNYGNNMNVIRMKEDNIFIIYLIFVKKI